MIKKHVWVTIFMVIVGGGLQAQLIDFQMNEGTGTSLSGLSQTGSDSAVFGAVRPAITDGAGNLVFSNTLSTAAGLPLSQVYSNSGLYRIEMRFDSWNMSAALTLANVNWLVQQTGDANVLNLTFRRHDSYGGMLFTVFGGTEGGQNTSTPLDATIPLISAGTGIVVRVDVDIEAGLYDFYWKWDTDSDFRTAGIARSLGGLPSINKMVLSSGNVTWGEGQFIAMDYYTVAYIEPSPYFIEYTMNDSAGTAIGDLKNTGNDHSSYADFVDDDAVTDGNGNLRFENVSVDRWVKHTPLTAISNGVVIVEWRVDSWDLSAATASNAVVSVGVAEGPGVIVDCQFAVISNYVSLGSYATGEGSAGNTLVSLTGTTGVVLRTVLDFDSGLYASYWKYDTDADFTQIVLGSMGNVTVFSRFDLYKLKGDSASWGEGQFVNIDYINVTLTNGIGFGPADFYASWAASYGIAGSVGLLDDPDGDCLDNLSEYALGGDPGNNEDIGIAGDVALTTDSGTNYFEYTYRKRSDAAARGLSYYLEKNLDLVSGLWTNLDYEVMGVGIVDTDFETITNRIVIGSDANMFLRLRIKSDF
ncbi:hypothetical protein [Tichowtungia aerotolerans]|uniref:Uncharacterized protein n=1 Tax=Tichowtungia aerotolerans TaxID=2697043 RepID=A0A6P1MA02_9BACT|nr:hypothetical protein [Tichowtungia aerotolerans]QHI70661.1 hypothetical protein GT409_14830 [Tichowtungia aerotolerans]